MSIGKIKKLVNTGDGVVATIGNKGTFRFYWEVAHSRGRVEGCADVRLNALVRYGFPALAGLADAMPIGAIIPLPSESRARNWIKRGSGPKADSRWFFESAIEAGFKPRYYLGEDENPYEAGSYEHAHWQVERVYLNEWPILVIHKDMYFYEFCEEHRKFMERIPDWQTKLLVAAMVEDEYNNGEWRNYEQYIGTPPLLQCC